MTTRIKITNDSSNTEYDKHNIEVLFIGNSYILKPGEYHILHIWEDTSVIVREVPDTSDVERLEGEGGYPMQNKPDL